MKALTPVSRLIIFLAGLLCAPLATAASERSEHFVARVYYESVQDISRLADYDLWEYNNLEQGYVLVALDQKAYDRLAAQGWRLEVDLQASATIDPVVLRARQGNDEYRDVDALYADLDAVHAAYPGITELVDYGDSYCKGLGGCVTLGGESQAGYDLRAIRITNLSVPGPKPVFFLMTNIHAREITTPELAMRWVDMLTAGYGADADITWIVDHHELWVVPAVNPDGRWLVDLGLEPLYGGSRFFQRKNADRDGGCNTWPPSSSSQYGIDLNRNHSYLWNTGGSSASACSQTFHGPGAASAMEVDQLEDLVRTLIPDQRADDPGAAAPPNTQGIFITLHSYGNWVLRPWGTEFTPSPNESGLKAVGDKLATYNGYTSCRISQCLYETSGTSDEWAYGELGVPAFTFEVGNEFMPPYADIDARQWPDNAPALLYAAKIARKPYQLAEGPDARNLSLTSVDETRVLLRATIDDLDNGGANIRRAFYTIDTPYWQPGFSPSFMRPADGANDSPVEINRALIDISVLDPGRHIVFVHGLDNANQLGPASAVFLDIP